MSAEIIDLRRHLARFPDEVVAAKAEAAREAEQEACISAALAQFSTEAVRIYEQGGPDAFVAFLTRTAKEGWSHKPVAPSKP